MRAGLEVANQEGRVKEETSLDLVHGRPKPRPT